MFKVIGCGVVYGFALFGLSTYLSRRFGEEAAVEVRRPG